MIWKVLKEEKGVAVVITALAVTVLFGSMALVADGGLLYLQRARLQSAVDAAALAGAQELPFSLYKTYEVAEDYAENNGLTSSETGIDVNEQAGEITVTARRQVEYFLAGIWGQETKMVYAQATARVGPLSSVRGAAPLAIEEHDFIFNEMYVLKQGANSEYESSLGPGNFNALSLGGSGSSVYENNLKYGYDEPRQIGDVVPTETGNMSGSTIKAVNYLIGQCTEEPECSPEKFSRSCPRLLIIPVFEPVETGKQVKEIVISGFAIFLVESVSGNGLESEIKGHFVRSVVSGEVGSAERSNFGLWGVKLVD